MKKLKKTSDEELLNLYQSNSEENLLNILLQRHMPQIRQNVRSLVCNKEDVEDLCQDIYCRILIKLRQGYYSNGHYTGLDLPHRTKLRLQLLPQEKA